MTGSTSDARSPAADRRLRRNSLINLTGFGLPIVVSLVTVPRYLTLIGQQRYGVLVIVWIMLGYFGVFDLGLGRATTHQVARTSDPDHANRIVWTAAGVNLGLGTIGGLVLVPVAYLLTEHVLKFPGELRHEVIASLPWLAIAVPMITVNSVFNGALQGRERFGSANVIIVVYGVLFQVVPLAVASAYSRNLFWLIGSVAAVQAITLALGFGACVLAMGLRRPTIDRSLVRSLAGFGGWVSVSGLISPLLTIMDRLAVGAAVGAAGVTRYSVPFNLAVRLWIVPSSLTRTLFPRLAMLPTEDAAAVSREALDGLSLVLTPIVIVCLLLAEPFLHVWVGASLGPGAGAIAAIILLGVWINGLAQVPNTHLQARGRPDAPAKLHAIEILPFLGLLWLGLKVAGVEGGAIAWSVRCAGDAGLLAVVSELSWRPDRRIVSGIVLLALSFAVAMLLPGTTVVRVTADLALLVATASWLVAVLPRRRFGFAGRPWSRLRAPAPAEREL